MTCRIRDRGLDPRYGCDPKLLENWMTTVTHANLRALSACSAAVSSKPQAAEPDPEGKRRDMKL
jgi:hypothetical protein